MEEVKRRMVYIEINFGLGFLGFRTYTVRIAAEISTVEKFECIWRFVGGVAPEKSL